jgi:hypothetical protein
MEIEQVTPKKPNFLLILILFCVALLVLFVVGYVFVRGDSRHLGFRHHYLHPTSQLVMPSTGQSKTIALV